jgi:tRNA threonylcarbamoyladenosine biosynthesis protein TsaE
VKTLRRTKALAKQFAGNLRARNGAVVLFYAPMGAGKTTFISFVIKELAPHAAVSSPTFSIINKYTDNIYHADLYRVGRGELENTGIFDIMAQDGNFVFIEWADKFEAEVFIGPPPATSLFRVKINILGETEREFIID